MKFDDVKKGEILYGIVNKYKTVGLNDWLTGIKIVKCEVVKVNDKSFAIAFSKDTKKYPQLIKKDKWQSLAGGLHRNKKCLIEEYLAGMWESKLPQKIKDKIELYCYKQYENGDLWLNAPHVME